MECTHSVGNFLKLFIYKTKFYNPNPTAIKLFKFDQFGLQDGDYLDT